MSFGEKIVKKPIKPEKEKAECQIKVKRNAEGKITSLERKGNCKREDIIAFSEQNNINLGED